MNNIQFQVGDLIETKFGNKLGIIIDNNYKETYLLVFLFEDQKQDLFGAYSIRKV